VRPRAVPYCRPDLGENEIAAVASALRNGWLTSGPNVAKLEADFVERAGVPYAVALSSCTAALHVALRAMGVGPGDEVVTPSLTFVAGAQCTLELGATPVFADVDSRTLSVNVETVDRAVTPRTKVIVAMPYAGRPLDIGAIVGYARERGIRVLEDAAHSVGMLDRGKWAGTCSDAAAYSFYATKNLTTAEGGMLLTNDPAIAERARVLGLHGMSKDAWKRYTTSGSWRYDVLEPGFKYNLPDPLAALGVAQLRRLESMQKRREEIAARYIERIAKIPGISVQAPVSSNDDRHGWCMFVILVDELAAGICRDALIDALAEAGIGTSVHYIPTHHFYGYRSLAREPLTNTDDVWQRLVSLPLYTSMSDSDVDYVLESLERLIGSDEPARAAAR
jgi:dTDP-4-amino-4,6-dideoxygalactose transaminase